MRVLLATRHAYFPQRYGGSETSTHATALALRSRGISVAVLAGLTPNGWTGIITRIKRKLLPERPSPHLVGIGYRVFRARDAVRELELAARHFKPDIVVVQAGHPLLLAARANELGIPVVVHLRDVQFDRLGGDPRSLEVQAWFANSNFTAARFAAAYGIDSEVIPNFVDPDSYRVPGPGHKVTFINPVPDKGLDVAFRLAERNPEIPFLFVEGWPLRAAVREELVDRARASGNIEWRPATRNMKTVYADTRVLIVPSQWEEAWGRVASEAQISGIPILASNRGGLPEAVGPGGLLLPHDDLEAWEASLRRLWHNPVCWQEYVDAARTHAARAELAPENILGIYVDALRRCLSDRVDSDRRLEGGGD